jgi:serine/threonine-protein kinase
MDNPVRSGEVRVDAKLWTERWNLVESLPSGAQALAMKVQNGNGDLAFLKELKVQDNSERRVRMYHEIVSIERLAISGVPRLVETNAHQYLDKSYNLYLATEFIEGQTLARAVQAGDVSHTAAVEILVALCNVLRQAHGANVFHRDIKPDNIILQPQGDNVTPCLLDFGTAHIGQSDSKFRTELGQEVGNRFLRLPEYGAGSENKYDARSDITLCAGILFFMLARTSPRVLQDHDGHYPHQRPRERTILVASGLTAGRLLAFFDVAFQIDIGKRFQNMDAIIQAAEGLLRTAKIGSQGSISLDIIRERLTVPSEREKHLRMQSLSKVLDSAISVLKSVGRELTRDYPPEFASSLAEVTASYTTGQDSISYKCGYKVSHDSTKIFFPTWSVEAVGPEAVLKVRADGLDPLSIRVPLGSELSTQDKETVRTFLVEGLARMTDMERTDSN